MKLTATEPQAQLQEVFNRVRDHLLKQGQKSLRSPSFCMYRGPEGRSCAVGCLIDDQYYNPLLENMSAGRSEVLAAVAASLGVEEINGRMYQLLTKLQEIHDSRTVEEWAPELNETAAFYGLTP